MRKLYALLAGLFIVLAGNHVTAQPFTPDVASFNFVVDAPTTTVAFNNNSTIGTAPGIRKAFWTFGDGTSQWTAPLANTTHHYAGPGNYTVCLKIYRYFNNHDSAVTADICKTVSIETICRANFEKLPIAPSANPLHATFRALPWHNGNKKPERICWTFGDGTQTCINYTNTYTGPYTVNHNYSNAGFYEVCVKIFYQGGCIAQKCESVRIGNPDSCRADFERLPVTPTSNPLHAIFKALPWHSNNKKPVRICWTFGDGRDTCINYPTSYTGPYTVAHNYLHPGQYEVCVKINYDGGCEARKCRLVVITEPDHCTADFERLPVSLNNPLQVYLKAIPGHNNNRKPSRVCWTFGDGSDTCINYPETYTGLYAVSHRYDHPGQYEVCVKIFYYGGCEARKCKLLVVTEPDHCTADFERLPVTYNDPLRAYFKAIPGHNNNRKPSKVCWTFGDGSDTCINYPETYTGLYAASHRYDHPGLYEVCVKIFYYGGCEARKCRPIEIVRPDSCRADFERIPTTSSAPLLVGFRALPWHNNNKPPVRICWTFGDGSDTCINYPVNYQGPYTVTHRYDHAGQYEVCVKIFYYGGCEARKCREIVVPPPQVNCSVRLFEIAPSITSLTRGFLAVPHTEPYRRPERVCWIFGDGTDTCILLDPQQPVPLLLISHVYPAPGVYRACVRIQFQGGCVAEDCREVVIRPVSGVCGGYMTDSLSGPRTFRFKGFSIHNPNDEVISWRWTFGDGSSALGREVTHTYNNAGNYEVCLYIRTRLGCETRICKTLRVPGMNAPALVLTPNPVLTVLHAAFLSTHTEQVNVKIVNGFGTVVRNYTRNATIGPNNWNFEVGDLLPGVYTCIVQSPNQLASAIFIKL